MNTRYFAYGMLLSWLSTAACGADSAATHSAQQARTGEAHAVVTTAVSGTVLGQAFSASSAIYALGVDGSGRPTAVVAVADAPELCGVLGGPSPGQLPSRLVMHLTPPSNRALGPGVFAAASLGSPDGGTAIVTFNAADAVPTTLNVTGAITMAQLDATGQAPLVGSVSLTDSTGQTIGGAFTATPCAALLAQGTPAAASDP